MPIISAFFGILVQMYFDEHNQPHIHIRYQGDSAVFNISDGERRILDMKPYLDRGVFRELTDREMFRTAHLSFDTVAWKNDIDLAPEILYERSVRY